MLSPRAVTRRNVLKMLVPNKTVAKAKINAALAEHSLKLCDTPEGLVIADRRNGNIVYRKIDLGAWLLTLEIATPPEARKFSTQKKLIG